MAHDRWDYDDPYRPRRHGKDEEYERDFWRDNESRGRSRRNPVRRYESTPVLGMDLGADRGRGDWRRFNEQYEPPRGGYARDTDWSNRRGDRSWWDRTQDEVRSWMGDTEAEHRRERDHRGRGPRGYTRSDDRIREDVSDWLMEDRYVDASDIDVAVAGGEVTLTGMVDSREMKRRAEDIAADVLGVKDVHNRLRVRSATASSADTSGRGASAGETSGGGARVGESSGTGARAGETSGGDGGPSSFDQSRH